MIVDSRPLTGKQVVHRPVSAPPATCERRRGQRHGTSRASCALSTACTSSPCPAPPHKPDAEQDRAEGATAPHALRCTRSYRQRPGSDHQPHLQHHDQDPCPQQASVTSSNATPPRLTTTRSNEGGDSLGAGEPRLSDRVVCGPPRLVSRIPRVAAMPYAASCSNIADATASDHQLRVRSGHPAARCA
jgi:hypothetical protein